MEDEQAKQLEMINAAMMEVVHEARQLRSESRQEIALQREALWRLQEERKAVRDRVSQTRERLRDARALMHRPYAALIVD
jgi:uncharacterized protein YlxW (UPF0749 family)